jgi:glutathione synthase/RimK-type ligase-like ATP-grasp enzyme
MTKVNFGICFSKPFEGNNPLEHIGIKLPVYLRLLEFAQNEGWNVYVLTRKTYLGKSIFNGAWLFENGEFKQVFDKVKIDIVYDRTGGVNFPPKEDDLNVFNNREFKILCWDKWMAYQEIGEYMPKTYWIGDKSGLKEQIKKIKTDWLVLKPFNGLKGIGIFIGPKEEAVNFQFLGKKPKYIVQEFLDTSRGIPKITNGLHDLRVAVVNGKVVWCHVRVPIEGTFKSNAAQGGNLTEVDYDKVPESVKKIVNDVIPKFSKKYNNPSYSLDFGIGRDGIPKIFEINDQIGFPQWEMKNRDVFLKELIESFK